MIDIDKLYFDQPSHKYYYEGVELSGITGILKSLVFPDMYADVPESVLRAAAGRGSAIHAEIELVDSLGVEPSSEEARKYAALREEHGLEVVASEQLVTDGSHVASAIDIVFRDKEGNIVLADVKTTYKLNKEYVSWQLSIYKYLYKLCFGKEAGRLVAIWLPKSGEAELVEIEEVPEEEVIRLLTAFAEGTPFNPPASVTVREENLPAQYGKIEDAIIEISTQIKELEEKEAHMKAVLLEAMTEYGVKKWTTERMAITRVDGGERESFDSSRFKKENKELYKQYIKVSTTKPSLRIKIN